MPSVSEKQRKFFQLVRAIQEGRAADASSRAKAVAKAMSKKDVRDFASAVETDNESNDKDTEMNKSAVNVTSDLLWQIAGISALSGAGLAGAYGLSKYLSDQYVTPAQIDKAKNQLDEVSGYRKNEEEKAEDSAEEEDSSESLAPNYKLQPVVTNEDEYLKAANFEKQALINAVLPSDEMQWESLAKGVATPVAAIVPALLTYHFTKKIIDKYRNKSLADKVEAAKKEFEEILTKESSDLQQQVDSLYHAVKTAGLPIVSDGQGAGGLRAGTYDVDITRNPILPDLTTVTPRENVTVGPGLDKMGLLYLAGALLAGGGVASYLALRNNLLKADKEQKKVKALRGLLSKNLAAEALQSGINIKKDDQGLPIVSL